MEINAYYDTIAPEYDRLRFANSYGAYIHAQELAFLHRHLPPRKSVLSLGCGTGRFMEFCSEGVDVAENMLREARSKYPDKKFACLDGLNLPYEDNSMDAVICFHVYMHLDKAAVEHSIREVYRVLKPGCIFIFDVPSALRRRISGRKPGGWHGANAFARSEIYACTQPVFTETGRKGIALFPVHRLPEKLRPLFRQVEDKLLPFMKNFASYYCFAFVK